MSQSEQNEELPPTLKLTPVTTSNIEDFKEEVNKLIEENTLTRNLPIKRDFIRENLGLNTIVAIPLGFFYGLNSFQFVQGLNGFLRKSSNLVVGWLPHFQGRDTYIYENLNLTRYRNFNDKY